MISLALLLLNASDHAYQSIDLKFRQGLTSTDVGDVSFIYEDCSRWSLVLVHFHVSRSRI